MPLPTLFVTPWSVALRRDEAGSPLADAVSQAVVAWHREGRVPALERHWGIPVSGYSARMSALWRKRAGAGWYCGEQVGASTPRECL